MSLQQVPHEFKRFMAREAMLDDELWTAAWLRAESHREDQEGDRYAENLKRKFAEQEFSSMKRRCKGQYGPRCMCIVTVWMDWDNVKHLVPRSVVGTLDLSIRRLSLGETFPGERVRPPFFCRIEGTRHNSTYGYIANLCVAKSARCQGIATSMMKFTIELAKASGVEQVYAHVHRHNRSARELYSKLGFKIVAEATDQLEEEKQYLLCLDI
ncbi:hypothetical protein MLD38_014248 [Melastoma candidum]|uniref:Uncharacterized protein n=1 Tax=Melastoma candidum TaxID=119954 RepID=A0ACB9RKL2_9MYRT|nr:hypothetical protein MLD38_014248 [Melastoma candidum]